MERRKPFMQNVKVGGPATIFDIKVMLCYLLNSLKKPISAENLLNIMMSEELVNYFEYESAMAELCNNGQVEKFVDDSGEEFYKISSQGAALVVDLESSIAMSLKSRVVEAALKVLAFRQNEKENNVVFRMPKAADIISRSRFRELLSHSASFSSISPRGFRPRWRAMDF